MANNQPVTTKLDKNFKKMIKKISAETDSTIIKTTKKLADYEKELKELINRK